MYNVNSPNDIAAFNFTGFPAKCEAKSSIFNLQCTFLVIIFDTLRLDTISNVGRREWEEKGNKKKTKFGVFGI